MPPREYLAQYLTQPRLPTGLMQSFERDGGLHFTLPLPHRLSGGL